jgi:hypothetical protein
MAASFAILPRGLCRAEPQRAGPQPQQTGRPDGEHRWRDAREHTR